VEAGIFNETEPEDWQGRKPSLSLAIIEAVSDVISSATGKTPNLQSAGFSNLNKEEDPAQVAMAVAYTSLCIEEPEMVTSSHKKMLRSAFSYEQIQELNGLIKKMMS
jgi:hypothetical protein